MWLVTREAHDGLPLVQALQARGLSAVCAPAIRREPLPWPAVLDEAAGSARGPVWLFLTSPLAARLALEHLGHLEHAGSALRFASLSPHTLAVVVAAARNVDVAAEGGATALARACAAAGVSGTVLYPTSDAGLLQDEQALALEVLSRTATVVRAPVYTTRDEPHLEDQLRSLSAPYRAVLFSPSAARALQRAVERTGAPSPVLVVAVGRSTARAWPSAATLAPAGVDIVDFLCSLPDS